MRPSQTFSNTSSTESHGVTHHKTIFKIHEKLMVSGETLSKREERQLFFLLILYLRACTQHTLLTRLFFRRAPTR